MNPMTFAAAAGFAGDLLGGLFSRGGQRSANAANLAIAREQMAFQERMSSSAHQREVADLRKAGLNPILSATGGPGASSPPGSQATMVNPDKAFERLGGSARASLQLKQELANMKATEGVARMQSELLSEQTGLTFVNNATAREQLRIARNEADLSDTLKLLDKKIYSGKLGEFLRRAQLMSSPVSSGSSLMRVFK